MNQQTSEKPYLTRSDLFERGWTDRTIRHFLSEPDATKSNPFYRSAAPMRLYARHRVEAAENSESWRDERSRTARRQESAAKAVATKRRHLIAHLDALEVKVPKLPMDTLMQRACAHFNRRQSERSLDLSDFLDCRANATCAPEFLIRITVNYLRHCLTRYEAELERIAGKVGVREGYEEINRRVYAAIAATYPTLAEECQRQLAHKQITV